MSKKQPIQPKAPVITRTCPITGREMTPANDGISNAVQSIKGPLFASAYFGKLYVIADSLLRDWHKNKFDVTKASLKRLLDKANGKVPVITADSIEGDQSLAADMTTMLTMERNPEFKFKGQKVFEVDADGRQQETDELVPSMLFAVA